MFQSPEAAKRTLGTYSAQEICPRIGETIKYLTNRMFLCTLNYNFIERRHLHE